MFGENNSTPQTDTPQSDTSMMQSGQLSNAPASTAPALPANDSAGDYMLEDGTPATTAPAAAATPDDTASPSAPATSSSTDELLDIKSQALQQLSPLLGHLDQTPEEKFRTTMMLIQASDNDALLKQAYEAAQAISDEKERAQALLDVINEINYFTQHSGQQ